MTRSTIGWLLVGSAFSGSLAVSTPGRLRTAAAEIALVVDVVGAGASYSIQRSAVLLQQP